MSDDQQIDALREDIEQTRGDMSQTIEQLQERLAPEQLQRDTGDIVQEVADRVIAEIQGKTGDLTAGLSAQIQAAVHGAATAKSEELLTQATAGAQRAGASLWELVATNPAPVALAAVAVGLLAVGGRSGSSDKTGAEVSTPGSRATSVMDDLLAHANTIADRATDATRETGERASAVVDRATGALSTGSTPDGTHLRALIGEQPLVIGLVALGLGAAIGLSLPETDQERDIATPLRDQAQQHLAGMGLASDARGLMDQAKGQVSGMAETVKTTMSDGLVGAKAAASEIAESAKTAAHDAATERGLR